VKITQDCLRYLSTSISSRNSTCQGPTCGTGSWATNSKKGSWRT